MVLGATLALRALYENSRERRRSPSYIGTFVTCTVQLMPSSEDFTISRLTAQMRYRWEIGPLFNLLLVYTRGGNLPNQVDSEFDERLSDAFNEPIADVVVVKIRYRFGY